MMRKTILVAALTLLLALPAAAGPIDPVDVVGDYFAAIVEFVEDLFSNGTASAPLPSEGGDDELGLSIEPYG